MPVLMHFRGLQGPSSFSGVFSVASPICFAHNILVGTCISPTSYRGTIMASQLAPREREVVRLASLGCTRQEIGKILKLAPSTVDAHKARAMSKLGTDKAALLTRLVLKLKITDLKDKLTAAEQKKSGRKDDGWN